MANLSSSKKMVRKIATRTARNKSHVTNMRTYIKKVEEAIASGNADEAKSALKEAQPKIMRVAQKGIFHKNTASRKVSRLAKKVKNITTRNTIFFICTF